MKKNYLEPAMQVVKINTSNQLLAGSQPVNSVSGNVFSNTAPTGGSGDARSRGFDDFGE